MARRANGSSDGRIELSPGIRPPINGMPSSWPATGRVDEGLVEACRAVELNPLSPSLTRRSAGISILARQYDRAIQHLQRAIQAFPDFVQIYAMLGLAYEAKGMHNEASDILEKAMQLTGGAPTLAVLLAHAHAGAGDKSQAQQLLQEFWKRQGITPIAFAALPTWMWAIRTMHSSGSRRESRSIPCSSTS